MLHYPFWSAAMFMAALACVPAVIFAVECITGSLRPARKRAPDEQEAGKREVALAVLVPAHDEEEGLAATLASIGRQLQAGDRLVVVADNCTDRTAAIAQQAGAEVVERHDPARRGKGYALSAGIAHLSAAPPPVVIIVDADCTLAPHALDRLAEAAATSGGPIQGRYLMQAPVLGKLDLAVSEFAFTVKNHVRPLGLSRLGLPCQLTGSGMAFPWAVLAKADLANGHLVEDMKLGLDLARQGSAPRFCRDAVILSQFPQTRRGLDSQRRRWEGGHLAIIGTAVGSFRNVRLVLQRAYVAMVLDVMVPPLTLLVLVLAMVWAACAVVALSGSGLLPLTLATVNVALLCAATLAAWQAHGQRALPARALGRLPVYVVRKMASYPGALLGRRPTDWVRTDRKS